MTEEELENRFIELCQEYAQEQGWEEFYVDFGLNVYIDLINPCLTIEKMEGND